MKNITLRQLKTFECISRNLSYSRAAEELYLTQPAVSMQIRQMEEHLGVTLFEQTGKKIALTAAGEIMLDHSRAILGKCHEAELGLQMLKTGVAPLPMLRVGVTTSGSYFFPRLLNEFSKSHPGIECELIVDTRDEITRKLDAGELDIAVMATAPDDPDIVVEYFAPHQFVLVASPNHPLVYRQNIEPSALLRESFIVRERGTDTRTIMNAVLGGRVDQSRLREISCTEAIKQTVMAGRGISMLSAHAVKLELQSGLLRSLDVQGFPVQRNWTIAYQASRPLAKAGHEFRQYVINEGARLIEMFSQMEPLRQVAAGTPATRRPSFSASRAPTSLTTTGPLRHAGITPRSAARAARVSNTPLFALSA